VPLCGSFAVALEDAGHGREERVRRVSDVRDYLWGEIKAHIPQAALNGPALGARRAANNLNISIPGLSGELAVVGLDAEGVAASTRSACTTGDENPSHVIEALGHSRERATEALRLTLLPDATRADARRIARSLTKIVQRQQNVVQ
jgi:cysteine desulfurase